MMQVVFFLLSFLTILLGAHSIVYVSFIHFFSITDITQKYILACILIFLSMSFFLSSVLAHLYENIFTRALYFLSGFWLGLLVNSMLALIAVWLILWINRYANLGVDKGLLGLFFFGLALFVSLYGVWNAFHPVVKHISVRIPGIPDVWKGKTIVQLSDVHLGHIYQAGFLKDVVEKVNTLHPKIVVITGDLFDGMDGHLDSLVQPLDSIETENGIFFVSGNHETYLGVEKSLAVLRKTKVILMQDEVLDVDGLKLIGVNYPNRGEEKDIITTLASLKDQFSGKPSVLLYHAPKNIDEVRQSGVNLFLAGHTHQGQQFPFQFITHIIHKGFDYGLYTFGDFALYTTSGVGTWGPAMRIGTQSEIVAITIE